MTEPFGLLVALEGVVGETELLAALARPGGSTRVLRRCVDLADLLAAASTGSADGVVLSSGTRRVDREAVDQLGRHGLAVVGVVPVDDESAERRLRMLGIDDVVAVDPAEPGAAATEVAARFARRPASRAVDVGPVAESFSGPAQGRLVAIWGPTGAPGRTTTATYLATELAALGHEVLLADADVYGGSVAQLLGILDESPGLAAAARAVNRGALDLPTLASCCRLVSPGLRVLTGIVRSDRWTELRPAALEVVWEQSRRLAQVVIVDCGFGLEQDEALSYDTAAPRRNGATLATLELADLVVAVGRADPVGVQRLLRTMPDLLDVVRTDDVRVVLTRVRKGPVGPRPEEQLRGTVARHAEVGAPTLIPEDQAAYDAALLAGRSLADVAPRSRARHALQQLARDVAPAPDPVSGRRRGRRVRARTS